MGAPSNRRRAGRYQVALATLRERHRAEFDLILLDLRSASAPTAPHVPLDVGAVSGAARSAARPQQPDRSTHVTEPGARNAGPVETSGEVSIAAARPS